MAPSRDPFSARADFFASRKREDRNAVAWLAKRATRGLGTQLRTSENDDAFTEARNKEKPESWLVHAAKLCGCRNAVGLRRIAAADLSPVSRIANAVARIVGAFG
jgi:hypothetical protein